MANLLFAIGAYDHNQLVGLIRVVGDGLTFIYVQELLVIPLIKDGELVRN